MPGETSKSGRENKNSGGRPQKTGQVSTPRDAGSGTIHRTGTESSSNDEGVGSKKPSTLSRTTTGLSNVSTNESVEGEDQKEDREKLFGPIRNEEGKISGKKILSVILKNMTITPATRSAARSRRNPTSSGKGKEQEVSESSSDDESDDLDVEVKIKHAEDIEQGMPPYWIKFIVPFDQTSTQGMVSWNGSENYTFDQRNKNDVKNRREKYLLKVLPKDVRAPFGPKNPKKTLTVFLHFTKAMEEHDGDQVSRDVENALESLIRLSKFVKLRILLTFASQSDKRLAEEEYKSMAVNLTYVIFSVLHEKVLGGGQSQERDVASGTYSGSNDDVVWRDYGGKTVIQDKLVPKEMTAAEYKEYFKQEAIAQGYKPPRDDGGRHGDHNDDVITKVAPESYEVEKKAERERREKRDRQKR